MFPDDAFGVVIDVLNGRTVDPELDSVATLRPFKTSRRDVRILLIRLRLIGDVVFTTPLIGALRKRYPDARLEYLVEPHAAAVVADNPHLDEVIVAAAPRAAGRVMADARLARELRARRYDVVIDLHGGPRSALLTLATGAPRRIGYRIPGRRWVYTERVARARDLRPRHSVLNQWDLLVPLGFGPPSAEDHATEMPGTEATRRRVLARLLAADIDPARDAIVVLHVSAGNPFRRWPADAFVELVARLARGGPGRKLLLLSGPSERTPRARSATAPARSWGRSAGRW